MSPHSPDWVRRAGRPNWVVPRDLRIDRSVTEMRRRVSASSTTVMTVMISHVGRPAPRGHNHVICMHRRSQPWRIGHMLPLVQMAMCLAEAQSPESSPLGEPLCACTCEACCSSRPLQSLSVIMGYPWWRLHRSRPVVCSDMHAGATL